MNGNAKRAETPADPLTFSVDEVAHLLGLSRSATYDAIARGEIPALRFGRRIVVARRALHYLLARGDVPIDHPSGRQD
jgi:excisionase family DNA binding protein